MHKTNILKTRIDALLNVLSEDVLVISQQGGIIFSSHTNSSLPWGGTDSLTGKQLTDIFPSAIEKIFQGMIDQALSLNQIIVKEILLDPKEVPHLEQQGMASTCWVEVRLAPSAGDEPCVVCRIEDISQRKKAERDRSQVQRDLLTGMYNRRALMPVLAQSIAQAHRYDWVCSLMLIDIDSLQLINDTKGWDAGDQILKRLAGSLNSLKRTADFLAKVGDDDFAILLPETNQEQGLLAAQRIRNMVADLSAPSSATDVSFTVSIGVATLLPESDSAEAMFGRSENYLVNAKRLGGNRIEGDQ